MIEVPYWWDRKLPSLAATVYNTRPDLFETEPQGKSIPDSPPSKTTEQLQPTKSNTFLIS